ncbi:MAG TPA: shikimate dehydrogenase [Chloroflexia bacterium]|nr:shikimate dehydrogenase [Chloroflexia bacterium]
MAPDDHQDTSTVTHHVGLIGYPVEHSLSPAMHNAAFTHLGLEYRYVLLPTPPSELERRVRECVERGFAGWNVTVPHKEGMARMLDEMSDEVKATGACNTVLVEGGKLQGFNTDTIGFIRGLEEAGGISAGSKAVVLGAGGAARGVAWALRQAGHRVIILSRKPEQAREVAEAIGVEAGLLDAETLEGELEVAQLLVNCTPAGMWPHVEESPVPDGARIPANMLVYDLVYRPRPTLMLRKAAEAGCRTQNGLAMLVYQGAAAFEIWTGRPAPIEMMRRACVRGEGLGVRG